MSIQVLNPDIAEYVGTLVYTNSAGGLAKVDGAPVLANDREDKATLVATSEDGLTLSLKPIPDQIADGDENVLTIAADADLGDGVKPLVLEAKIVWSREAANVALVFSPVQ